MRTLLVTGGAGFIGANFVHYWHRQYPADRIVVLDALTYAGNLASLSTLVKESTVQFVHGDICDAELAARLFGQHNFDRVVHFAAESHVDRSISSPDIFVRTNVQGTLVLLNAVLAARDKSSKDIRFHHVSTDEVYGSLGASDAPFTEASPYNPKSPYAASKAGSDFLVRAYSNTYGLPATISNCSNNYGRYQFPEKLIPLMTLNALMGRVLPVYGDGMNIRDWLHVADHCVALEKILLQGQSGETYNIGGDHEISNIELVRVLCDVIDARIKGHPALAQRFRDCPASRGTRCRELITFVEDRPGHDRRYAIDSRKVQRDMNFRPRVAFAQGLADTVDWYLGNEAWWRPIQSGEYRNWIKSHYGMTI